MASDRPGAPEMKVLLVDDHPLILAALQSVIRGLGDDVTVVGVSTEKEARAALKRDPDLWVVEVEDRAGRHPFDGKIL